MKTKKEEQTEKNQQTGKVLNSRPLTPEEMQIGLKLESKKDQTEAEKQKIIDGLPN